MSNKTILRKGTKSTKGGNNPALDRLSYFDDPDFSRAMGLAVKSKKTLIPVVDQDAESRW